MKTSIHFLVAGLLAAACGEGAVSHGVDLTDDRPQEIQAIAAHSHKALCPDADGSQIHCFAKLRVDEQGKVIATDSVMEADVAKSGLTPADLKSAYRLPNSGGDDMTVAIVDAMDNPDAESDLATYRARFGLPPCTSSNGCFQKVNQRGQVGNYPDADPGWAGEIALDIDMVSAVCPNCKILLVEADSASLQNLGTALNTAVRLGADVVSNSYGGAESASSANADSQYFNHPGVAITAAAGDTGYGVNYPASSRYVTAVGGTTLARSTAPGRGWVESVWGSGSHGTGSGCSAHSAKPDFQKDPSCNKRMVADVAAVADPNSGVAVYDRYGSGGWVVAGGTSAASPIVAATLALTGHAKDSLGYSYFHPDQFFDVTTGKNGACTTGYFCKGAAGYDGPTGNGTPNGAAMAHQAPGGCRRALLAASAARR